MPLVLDVDKLEKAESSSGNNACLSSSILFCCALALVLALLYFLTPIAPPATVPNTWATPCPISPGSIFAACPLTALPIAPAAAVDAIEPNDNSPIPARPAPNALAPPTIPPVRALAPTSAAILSILLMSKNFPSPSVSLYLLVVVGVVAGLG